MLRQGFTISVKTLLFKLINQRLQEVSFVSSRKVYLQQLSFSELSLLRTRKVAAAPQVHSMPRRKLQAIKYGIKMERYYS